MLTAIVIVLLLIACMVAAGYFFEKKYQKKSEKKSNGLPLKVEEYLAKDFQDVISSHRDENTYWYCSIIELSDYLDSDSTLYVNNLSNVFQNVFETEGGADTFVITYNHTETENKKTTVHDFWVEDNSLNVLDPRITFSEALEKLMASNYPKPHSKQCVLRNQVGPNAANTQYIFGNTESVLFVDSVTGEVSDINPFFNN